MTTSLPTFDSVLHGTALAALCLIGTSVAAADAPAKAAKPPATRVTKKPAPKPVETGPADASAEQIDAAERVYYGVYDCEFNQTVNIQKNTKYAAYVDLRSGKSTWIMKPVLSSTGAIRLEDIKGETLMVQIASKSMLLNVKTARRIVDDCVSPRQHELIEAAKAAKAGEAAAAPAAALMGAAPAPK